jgi:hypothetical protein
MQLTTTKSRIKEKGVKRAILTSYALIGNHFCELVD